MKTVKEQRQEDLKINLDRLKHAIDRKKLFVVVYKGYLSQTSGTYRRIIGLYETGVNGYVYNFSNLLKLLAYKRVKKSVNKFRIGTVQDLMEHLTRELREAGYEIEKTYEPQILE